MSTKFSLRLLNEAGINEYERIVGEIRKGNLLLNTNDLIFNEQYTEVFEPIINIEKPNLNAKNELIPFLVEKLDLRNNKFLYFNIGLWSWLSAVFFDVVCPLDHSGKRKVNESAFYILREPKNYTKYNRHLLAYPCRLYSELGDSSKIFLIGTFSKRGEITEQFSAYQEISLNKGILDAAAELFWDEPNKNLKRGAAGKGAGSARRLIRIIRQYQMTYDLNSMSGSEIVALLPAEFDKWQSKN